MDYCESIGPIIYVIKAFVNILQWVIPIGLIVFGIIDLGKAVISSKEDEMKKAQGILIKRCIYAVAVFFVVFIVQLLMGIVADSGAASDNDSWLDCWKHPPTAKDN